MHVTLHVDLLLYVASEDYNEITNQRVVFNPGVSTQTVTLTTLPDAQTEGDEDLTVTITAESGIDVYYPEATVTITEFSMFHESVSVVCASFSTYRFIA